MWNTTTSSNKTATASALALSMMCFNTHAYIDIDDIVPPQNDVIYSSNISGEQWSSVGVSKATESYGEIDVLGISDIVDSVKVALGLPNKDIASIFGVSRQTLHSYKNSTDEHTVNSSNKKRALTLSEIIDEISPKFDRSPGAMAKNYTRDGKSLLDLLSESNLNIAEIVRLADSLSEKMSSNLPKNTATNEVSLRQLTKVS